MKYCLSTLPIQENLDLNLEHAIGYEINTSHRKGIIINHAQGVIGNEIMGLQRIVLVKAG